MRLARLLPVLCVVLCAATPARAETAGQVLAAVGDALALRTGQIVHLYPGASVESGDQIHTGAAGYLQIRFTDWGIVSLRPRTDFVVDEYVYEARQGGREKAFFSLLKGGIRSLTGAIGHRDRANYRLRTPITTIGIRGTHFSVLMCKQDCRNPDGTLGEDGLYGEVLDGRIAVSPYGGGALEREFGAGERFRLDSENSVPLQLFSVPPFFPDKLDPQARSGGKPESAISSAGRVVPGAGSAAADLNLIPRVAGGLVGTLAAIVPAKPGARGATALVGSAVAPISGAVITPLANGVVLPAEGLAGSVVNSALSMPALGPAFPLLGSALNSVPAVVAPIVNPIVAPVVNPIVGPVAPVITPIVNPIVAPVTPVIGPVVNPIVAPVTPVIDPIVNPIVAPVTPVIGPVVDPIVAPVAPIIAPVTNPIVAPAAAVIAPVTNPIVAPIAPVIAPPTNTVSLPTVPSLPVTSGLPSLLRKK